MKTADDLKTLQNSIGYAFRDEKLLLQAITHSSYANEHREEVADDYERLEFIGDAILEMVSSLKLFRDFPDCPEGELTCMRASLVCEDALNIVATTNLNIPQVIRLGKGEVATGGRTRPSILCDVVESIIGAVYLDGGIEPATRFIEDKVLKSAQIPRPVKDKKTELQEYIQVDGAHDIRYEILDSTGPDHHRCFTAAVYVDGSEMGRGTGYSKKLAQMDAADAALKVLMKREK